MGIKKNNENAIVEQTRKFAQLCSGRQKDFFIQMLADLKEVKISPLSSVFTKDEIREIKESIDPQAKECYKNSFELARLFNDRGVQYVEGYATCIEGALPIEHAWNKVGDSYVDITFEMALNEKPWENKEVYMTLGTYTYDECISIMYNTRVYGGIYYHTKLNK